MQRAVKLVLLWLALGNVRVFAGEFEFLVIGDTRPTFESENFRNFETLIPRMNALKPALIINVGDLIYGYGLLRKEQQWDRYERVIHAIQAPYFQLPGNHDTYSKEARRVYGRRFGTFYQSFTHKGCHFVLLDNTEQGRWGYIGSAELKWLQNDLKTNQAPQVFVFMHFPVWDPDRVEPRAYEFWRQTLHPLFREFRVQGVFGGHYHSYGPTREFDGIRYFITGGGGAELRPEYKRSGGEYHFMRVKVGSGSFDVRVETERGELSDTDADVMGGLQFGDRNSTRIGIRQGAQNLQEGVEFSISLYNPYRELMRGKADWVYDASAFSVDPQEVEVEVPPGGTERARFTFKALQGTAMLQSLPRLAFNVTAAGRRHKFQREVRILQELASPYEQKGPVLDGTLEDWGEVAKLSLRESGRPDAQLRSCHDAENLYLAVTIPAVQPNDEDEMPDELQIGMARRLSDTDFGSDFLRLGFSSASHEARNRTPGRRRNTVVPGIKSICRTETGRRTFEIAVPLRFLKHAISNDEPHLVVNLSFRLPDPVKDGTEPAEPEKNSFYYSVRYGTDSLLPVHFIELNLSRKSSK